MTLFLQMTLFGIFLAGTAVAFSFGVSGQSDNHDDLSLYIKSLNLDQSILLLLILF